MSGAPPPLSTQRRLGPGPVLRRGASASYRALILGGGEPHQLRSDLAPGAADMAGDTSLLTGLARAGRPLLSLVHITDLQLADVQSPARFEFLNRYFADPRYAEIVPVQRPQEAFTAHAVQATVRTLNQVTGPASGMAPQLAVTTGDAIDNAQWNELLALFALFDGGLVTMRTDLADRGGSPARVSYDGVQLQDWPDDMFWKPDGPGPDGPDIFRREFGFGDYPGVLELAVRAFSASGLAMPWLSCYGNHEALNQGVGITTPALARAMTGNVKPVALPDGFDHDKALELFTYSPEAFMAGPLRHIRPDPGRRPISRQEFVQAHFRPGASPDGHGFTARNKSDGTAYYCHDTPAARLIALDTTCVAGGATGCLDHDQARWLEEQLAQVHGEYRRPDGAVVRTGNEDRLVILFSHHGVDTLTNTGCGRVPDGLPMLGGTDVLRLIHRFGNVVLWLNGHTHANAVRPRQDPVNPVRGFWEVTTCAVVDWPCQTRLVELLARPDLLTIVCTMVDHDAPASPAAVPGLAGGSGGDAAAEELISGLASLHRELAANMPFIGADSPRAGDPPDRNVVLHLAAPFPLDRLAR